MDGQNPIELDDLFSFKFLIIKRKRVLLTYYFKGYINKGGTKMAYEAYWSAFQIEFDTILNH